MPNYLKAILRAPAGEAPEGGGDGGNSTDTDIYGADLDDAGDDTETTENNEPEANEPPVPQNPAATATPAATPAASTTPAAPAPAATPANTIDPKVIEDAIRKFVPQPAAAPAQQKSLAEKDWEELTDDEFNLRSKRVLVNPQLLHDIGIPDATPEQVGKFQALVDGIASHAIELSVAEYQRALKHAEARYEPMFTEYKKYQALETENKFYGEHKDLAELRKTIPKFDDLVAVTAKSINPKHPNGAQKTYEDVSAELAGNLRTIFKSIAPNGLPSPSATPAPAAPVVAVPTPAPLHQPGRSSRVTQGTPANAAADNGASIY